MQEPYALTEKYLAAILSYELPYVSDAIVKTNHHLWTICRACWHPDSLSRPTMQAVLECLRDWTLNVVNLPNLYQRNLLTRS